MTKDALPSTPKTMSNFFWGTIVILALITAGLYVVGYVRAPTRELKEIEVSPTILEKEFSKAAKSAYNEVLPNIDRLLDEAYAFAYAAVPSYASFHFSVLGEYTELAGAAMGKMNQALYDRLFSGFEDRMTKVGGDLDVQYFDAYSKVLQAQLPSVSAGLPLGPITHKAIEDAMRRAKITVPLATVAATAAGSGALKAATTVIAKKLALKISGKAAAKGLLKVGGIGGAVVTGATVCAPGGPLAVVCGVAAGIGAWLLTDKAVVMIDEYFNRDEFEAELRKLINEDKASKRKLLEAALQGKAQATDKAANFTLYDLAQPNSKNNR